MIVPHDGGSSTPVDGGASADADEPGLRGDGSDGIPSQSDASAECALEESGMCGDLSRCCGPLVGYRYNEAFDCIERIPTSLACRGAKPCVVPGQIKGCLTSGGKTFFLTESGTDQVDGWDHCSEEVSQKVMGLPRCDSSP